MRGDTTEDQQCFSCGEVKSPEAFPSYNNGKHRYKRCRPCHNDYYSSLRKAKRQSDPAQRERDYENARSYRARYSEGYKQHRLKKRAVRREAYFNDLSFRCRQLVSSAKRRAEKKGFAFDLDPVTLEAIIRVQQFKCSVTGTPFELSESAVYLRSPRAPSIDRRNSDLGYTWDNVQIVAAWYNIFKNEWSDADARDFIEIAYKTLHGGR